MGPLREIFGGGLGCCTFATSVREITRDKCEPHRFQTPPSPLRPPTKFESNLKRTSQALHQQRTAAQHSSTAARIDAAQPAKEMDPTALHHLRTLAQTHALDLTNAKIRRTSSRFCLGVEHGDYNSTNLFGVGTDRYIWVAYKANNTNQIRLASGNFPDDGLITFASGSYPTPPLTEQQSKSWARFPHGVDFVLRKEGLLQQSVGFDAVVWGNIPGGGMSRF